MLRMGTLPGSLLFWALVPVAALQGLRVRRIALQLPPPSGPGNGCSNTGRTGKPLRLRALGDSIVAGVGIEQWQHTLIARFAERLAQCTGRPVEWSADGNSGDTIRQLLTRLPESPTGAPADFVLVSIGVNDVTGMTSLGAWRRRVRETADVLRRIEPNALIVFAGLPPMDRFPLPPQPLRFCLGLRARRLDRILAAEAASRRRCVHVPTEIDPATDGFCADGFHPDAASCARWARELAARLRPLIDPRETDADDDR